MATLAPLGSVENVLSYVNLLAECEKREDRYLALYALACTKNASKLSEFVKLGGLTTLRSWLRKDQAADKLTDGLALLSLSVLHGLPITQDDLRSTKIGKTVNTLSKATPTTAASMKAKEVVSQWQAAVLGGGSDADPAAVLVGPALPSALQVDAGSGELAAARESAEGESAEAARVARERTVVTEFEQTQTVKRHKKGPSKSVRWGDEIPATPAKAEPVSAAESQVETQDSVPHASYSGWGLTKTREIPASEPESRGCDPSVIQQMLHEASP